MLIECHSQEFMVYQEGQKHDTGRPVFLKYGSTRIGAFDPLGTP